MNLVKSNRFVIAIFCGCVLVALIFLFSARTCVQQKQKNEDKYLEKLIIKEENDSKPILNSFDRILRIEQRGEYWVFYNLLVSKKTFAPYESVTYTTQGDFTFLDNVQPLLERWKGPISIALYAPGDDFQRTVESIHYLRDCTTDLMGEFVTFHVLLKGEHLPNEIQNLSETFDSIYNCDIEPSFKSVKSNETYRALNNLTYPINVARNVAKESSQTHFVLASDIELYPSVNIIEKFLKMINRTQIIVPNSNPIVFPLNVFEVEEDTEIPATKTELLKLLKTKKAINFHRRVCAVCHLTPNHTEWINTNETEDLNVFSVGKRIGQFKNWEPFYIGPRNGPSFDERLSWEGKRNKMTQGYILCVKDYDMMILDNAFLVHKPGIKVYHTDRNRYVHVARTNVLIKNVIRRELGILFGVKKGCVV